MNGLNIFGVAACATVLASCASMGGETSKVGALLDEATGQNGRACVRVSDIEGYGVLQDNVISIDGRGEHYLATVQPGCEELPASARILFSGDFGEVCGQAMDEIVMGEDRCTINKVFEFDDRDDAMDAYNAILERREKLKEGEG